MEENNSKMNGKIPHIFIAVALAVSAVACTDVRPLIPGDNYSDIPGVNVILDWTGLDDTARPDSVSVVLDRIVNSQHRWFDCSSEGCGPKDSLKISCGEWLALALDENLQNISYYGLDEFRTSDTTALKDITASVDTLPFAQIVNQRGLIDTNPGIPVYSPVSGMVCGFSKASVTGVYGAENNIVLQMEDLTAPVEFQFDIQEEGDVQVISVLGEISGVPGKANLMSREAVADKAGRTLFQFVKDSTKTNADGLTGWIGDARVLGIVPPEDASTLLGDGILTVRLRVMNAGSRKTFIASMNLKPLLEADPLLKNTSRNHVYRRTKTGKTIYKLTTVLRLTPDGVEPSGGSGVGAWVSQAKIDEEV